MRRLVIPQSVCALCGKGSSVGVNKPHSLHRTKRVIKPNLQSFSDPESGIKVIVCTRCLRTLTRE